jgi:hypothetical protein
MDMPTPVPSCLGGGDSLEGSGFLGGSGLLEGDKGSVQLALMSSHHQRNRPSFCLGTCLLVNLVRLCPSPTARAIYMPDTVDGGAVDEDCPV